MSSWSNGNGNFHCCSLTVLIKDFDVKVSASREGHLASHRGFRALERQFLTVKNKPLQGCTKGLKLEIEINGLPIGNCLYSGAYVQLRATRATRGPSRLF